MDTLIPQTNWLKDYDPLFDLFEEEMSSHGQHQPNNINHYDEQYHYGSNDNCIIDLNNYHNCDHDLTSQHHIYCPFKTTPSSIPTINSPSDELSIFLGLEWMPYLELASLQVTNNEQHIEEPRAPHPSPSTPQITSPTISHPTVVVKKTNEYISTKLTSISKLSSSTRRKLIRKSKGTSLLAKPSPSASSILNQNDNIHNHYSNIKLCVQIEHTYSAL